MSQETPRPERAPLDLIFSPRSLAVVGATGVAGTVPYDIFANIVRDRFRGLVFPVSPGSKCLDGFKPYKYVKDIDDPVDLAVVVFPSSVCHMALEQCGQKGIKAAIIISAGFREVGGQGIEREKRIREIAERYGISFIGPNINTDPATSLNASFARKMPAEGNIAFLSQSGALCTGVLDYAQAKGIGFSKFVSFGNKADISEIDLLYYLKDDPKTKVILMYLEEVSDGEALMRAAKDIIRQTHKPILALKSGRTSHGAAAAASHTGSLAGSDEICDEAMRQAGIIRCSTIEDMFNKAIALAYQPLPKGDRVAIITNAGGPGVLATDAAVDEGLQLAQFSEKTTEVFKKSLPNTANIKNPVDVIGDARADRYDAALSAALADEGVDGALVILTPQSMTDIDEIASAISTRSHSFREKPLYASFMGAADVASGIDILQRSHIPHYSLPENMCAAFAAACRFRRILQADSSEPVTFDDVDRSKANSLLDAAAAAGTHHLPQNRAEEVLAAYGLPLLPSGLAGSADEAAEIAARVGWPVVMKVVSDEIVHKADIGGVVVGIEDEQAARRAYESITAAVAAARPDAKIDGVLVQKMATGGEEVILGVTKDPSFGTVVMFGLGGTFVEVFRDVSFRVVPVEASEVAAMVRQIQAYPLLAGTRGRARRDIAAVETCIQRLSQLAAECPRIRELDINPLIVLDEGKGCFVADARIMI